MAPTFCFGFQLRRFAMCACEGRFVCSRCKELDARDLAIATDADNHLDPLDVLENERTLRLPRG